MSAGQGNTAGRRSSRALPRKACPTQGPSLKPIYRLIYRSVVRAYVVRIACEASTGDTESATRTCKGAGICAARWRACRTRRRAATATALFASAFSITGAVARNDLR